MTTKTIKSSGGDFSSLTSWKSYLSVPLTAPEQADIYIFAGGLNESLGFSGFTTTATNKLIINVPSGQRHNGTAHSGAYVYGAGGALRFTEDYVEINWLEIEGTGGGDALQWQKATGGGDSHKAEHCILHSGTTVHGGSNGTFIYRNNLNYSSAAARLYDARGATAVEISNCVYWSAGGDFPVLMDSATVVKNSYAGGGSTQDWKDSGGTPTGNNNASSDTSATTLFSSSLASKAGATCFTSVTSGSEDFRTKSGFTAFNDVGATLGAVTDDIIGTSRPQGSAYDIGIFENITGGSPDITLALTGQSVTASAGTLAKTSLITLALVGAAATATPGTIAPARSVALSGSVATASPGSLGAGSLITIGLTGSAATASAGFISVPGDKTVALTGQGATAFAGTLAATLSKALTGQSVTASAGSLSKSSLITIALTGAQASCASGTMTASGGSPPALWTPVTPVTSNWTPQGPATTSWTPQ